MRIKKKTIYIILVTISVLLIGGIYLLIKKGVIDIHPQLDKYESLIDSCNIQMDGLNVNMTCDAFLQWTEYDDNGNKCLKLLIVEKDNTTTTMDLCDKDIIPDTSDRVFDTDMVVPVYLKFSYKYDFPFKNNLNSISMEVMEDTVISEIIHKLSENDILIENLRTQEIVDIQQKGYYFSEPSERTEGNDWGTITFVNGTITDISLINDEILFKLNILVNGEEREIEQRVGRVDYLKDLSDTGLITIDTENISEIDKSKSFSVSFIYIPQGSQISRESLEVACNDINNGIENLCDKKDSLNSLILDSDIEEYVKDSLDKLIMNFLIPNE